MINTKTFDINDAVKLTSLFTTQGDKQKNETDFLRSVRSKVTKQAHGEVIDFTPKSG